MRRLLVIATAPIDDAVLREEVRQHAGSEEAEIYVVAPAARLSRLRWLASDEDEARAKATEVAREMEQALEETGSVDAEVGDPDPIQAIEDALRLFPADELLVVTRSGSEASWLEKGKAKEALERLGLPVTRLTVERH